MTGSKAELRRFLRETPEEPDSNAICDRIFAHPWYKEAKVIMAFMPKYPEPDITPVLQHILDSGRTLLLPRCDTKERMTARVIREFAELQTGMFGLLEPAEDAEVFPPDEIHLILVPGAAFDEMGHRLGHGRGYYDRFLTGLAARTIGIGGRILPSVPVHSHDRDMDSLVTDKKTILWDRRTTHVGREAEKE